MPVMHDRLKRVVDKISGLPTLPSMLSSINKLMLNPRTSAKEVAQLISSDPAIASKILRVVNSSFYGFPNRITTISHAIVILGFNTIKSIVLSSTIFDVFHRDSAEARFNRTDFWKHSIGCGCAAKVIAKALGITAVEELFIAGLLHDVGKIVVDQFLQPQFQAILDLVEKRDILIAAAEEEVLGVTHAEIGSWLFQRWNLSKALIESAASHHNPALASENARQAAIVHLADIVCRAMQIGSGGDRRIPPLSDYAWRTLGLPMTALDSILEETQLEMERAVVFLDFTR